MNKILFYSLGVIALAWPAYFIAQTPVVAAEKYKEIGCGDMSLCESRFFMSHLAQADISSFEPDPVSPKAETDMQVGPDVQLPSLAEAPDQVPLLTKAASDTLTLADRLAYLPEVVQKTDLEVVGEFAEKVVRQDLMISKYAQEVDRLRNRCGE